MPIRAQKSRQASPNALRDDLHWWHRNVARSQYAVQGWRREKIYPDFIFALQHGEKKEHNRLMVLEMKDQHLAGNPDTDYKQTVLRLMNDAYAVAPKVGELELIERGGTMVHCDLVLMPDRTTRLPGLMKP